MDRVQYQAPDSLERALSLMSDNPGAAVLAGGTDLLVQYRAGIKSPTLFVDVKRIGELVGISADDSGVRIGAATSAAEICEHPLINRLWPGLIDAVRLIGSPQIQGRGTIGGNLCNGSPAADSTCALIVSRARLLIAGLAGTRSVAVEDFSVGPGKTVLARGELLVAVNIPRPALYSADAYLRLIPRTEMDIAVAGAAVSVTLDEAGVCSNARVAVGAVAPTALLVRDAAAALIGSAIDEDALNRAGRASSAAARPIDDRRGTAAYRIHVVGVLTRRAGAIAARRAGRTGRDQPSR
jgi:CO/xanthine dehydrogenase FAD-binding subunit